MLASTTPHNDSRHIMQAHPLQAARLDQARRHARWKLPPVSRSTRRIVPSPQGRAGGGRRLPQVRVPQASRRRLPLQPVPRRARRRARAEAPGRHRRGGHRRVRGAARQGARREQSGPRDLALERQAQAARDGSLLVAAAGSRAARRTGLAVVAGERQAAPAVLIPAIAVRGAAAPVVAPPVAPLLRGRPFRWPGTMARSSAEATTNSRCAPRRRPRAARYLPNHCRPP